MLLFDQLNKGDRALRSLAWGVLAGLLVLLGGLWKVQVMSGAKYRERQETQSFRTVRVPAMRGRILDRNGEELAGNRPRYRLEIYLDELRPQFTAEYYRLKAAHFAARPRGTNAQPDDDGLLAWLTDRFGRRKRGPKITGAEINLLSKTARYLVVSNTIAQISQRLGTPLSLGEEAFHQHYLTRRALPMPVIDECTPEQVARITEQGWDFPGVQLELVPVRNYPHGSTAAHIVGHLQRKDDFDVDLGRFDYRQRDYVGGLGLERAYDRELRGAAGAKSILVNSAGYRHREGVQTLAEPQPGMTLVTTLDLELQQAVEKALATVSGDERGGAVVVMNSTNGDVLAAASAPTFHPGEFVDGVSWARWTNVLMAVPARPMLNRATYGEYAPGSTYKIFTALACLEAGVLTPETVHDKFHSLGFYRVSPRSRPIGDTAGAGEFDFRRAFLKSSNPYFIHHGLQLGFERLIAMGRSFGLGQFTGIRFGEEADGDLPSMEEIHNRGWGPGNLAHVSMGQEITVTPLQMAVAVSAVANGGKVFWPRLVDRLEPPDPLSGEEPVQIRAGQLRHTVSLPRQHYDLVRSAMRDDVSDPEGSGRAARLPGFAICGKTGTAEVKSPGRRDKITWFASFGPYEAPRYTVIVMVESGASGGGTCAPVARRIYQFLHQREQGAGRGLVAN